MDVLVSVGNYIPTSNDLRSCIFIKDGEISSTSLDSFVCVGEQFLA